MNENVVQLYNFYIHQFPILELYHKILDNQITLINFKNLDLCSQLKTKLLYASISPFINWNSFLKKFSVKDFSPTFYRSERFGIHVRYTCLYIPNSIETIQSHSMQVCSIQS